MRGIGWLCYTEITLNTCTKEDFANAMQCHLCGTEPRNLDLLPAGPQHSNAQHRNRPAALIFPGGGYQYCSDREAEPVALAYLAEGYNAFVLRYTVGTSCPLDKALQDAQGSPAPSAGKCGPVPVSPRIKIVAIGFSAGGHLAAALGTQSEEKPNALVLGYAVTLGATWAPMGRLHEPIWAPLSPMQHRRPSCLQPRVTAWCRLRIAWFLRKLCQNMISRSRCIFSRPGTRPFTGTGPAPAPVIPPV